MAARELSRRYGEGDTAVDALCDVSLDVAPEKLTAMMGPSGSGKSTLMHLLAGLDRPTAGEVWIDGTNVAHARRHGAHEDPAPSRRLHLPVLQPAPDAHGGGEHRPAARARRAQARDRVGRRADRQCRPRRPAADTGPPSSPAASSSGLRSRARSLPSRRSSSPTSRPATSTRQTSGEILAILRDAVSSYGQTTVMVTHDAHAAAIADRILFLADGRIVKQLGPSSAHEVLEVIDEVSRP